jgi:sigma-E factor negative regulatory protein RseA
MSEKLKESLSAVIDSEADEFELRRVLDEIAKDTVLASSWERYHLIGSIMRQERVTRSNTMREQIWAELQSDSTPLDEPVLIADQSSTPGSSTGRRSRWTGVAVAATVVLAAAVGLSNLDGVSDQPASDVALSAPGLTPADSAAAVVSVAVEDPIVQTVALTDEISDVDQVRTDAYIITHVQQLGMNQPSLGGFAKMVAYRRH